MKALLGVPYNIRTCYRSFRVLGPFSRRLRNFSGVFRWHNSLCVLFPLQNMRRAALQNKWVVVSTDGFSDPKSLRDFWENGAWGDWVGKIFARHQSIASVTLKLKWKMVDFLRRRTVFNIVFLFVRDNTGCRNALNVIWNSNRKLILWADVCVKLFCFAKSSRLWKSAFTQWILRRWKKC